MRPISEVADRLGLDGPRLLPFGDDKAKIRLDAVSASPKGKLVLVSAMSPSPAGEGKTTTSVGLTDALNLLGHRAAVAVREPSMGPVFGMKGGGTGGGRAQVAPADAINLHFTGDFHAIAAAHNLLAATIDNHMHHGNALDLDVSRILWNRVLDVNDRALRWVVTGLGGRMGGVPRESRFDITAASEIMAILALARDYDDLRTRLGNIAVGFTRDQRLVRASELKVEGSLLVLLKEALMPNLAQTMEGNPAIIHAGPFANIAHGTSSVLGTLAGMSRADFVVQEAGFGSDLGGEKFFDIFCRVAGVLPSCVVVVATLRAMRYHAGVSASEINQPNLAAVREGLCNPISHLETLASFGVPVVVALNEREGDPEEELEAAIKGIRSAGFPAHRIRVFSEGGAGATELAEHVADLCNQPRAQFRPVYELADPLTDKLEKITRRIYGGDGVDLTRNAERQLGVIEKYGFRESYLCMAKTQYSFSDDPLLVGRPRGFRIMIREVRLAAGAGFVIPISGEIMTMPGLAKVPNLERIDLEPTGAVRLF